MRTFVKGTLFGVTVTAVLAGTTALAGNGVGGVFNLGQPNTVTAKTALTGGVAAGIQLDVNNPSTVAGSQAIRGIAAANRPAILGSNTATGPGLQGSSYSGAGIVATSQSKSAPGAAVSNVSGGPGVTIDVVKGVAPLVVNSSTKVDNLNADLLDGLESDAFSRLIAMRSDNAHGSLGLTGFLNNDNYFLGETFTPSASGRCLVTVGSQILGAPTLSAPPLVNVAIKRGTGTPSSDNSAFAQFLPIGFPPAFGGSDYVTTSATFDVVQGSPVRFAAHLYKVGADWVHRSVNVNFSYLCMTTGTFATAKLAQAHHSPRHQRSTTGSASRHHRR
jgi:hypothetical protein